ALAGAQEKRKVRSWGSMRNGSITGLILRGAGWESTSLRASPARLYVSSKARVANEATRRTTLLKRCRDMNTYKRCPSRGHCKPLPSREKRATASASCVSRRLLLEFGTSPAKGLAQAALGPKAHASP